MNFNMATISRCANAGRPGIRSLAGGRVGCAMDMASSIPDSCKISFVEGVTKGIVGTLMGTLLTKQIERRAERKEKQS